MGQLVKNSGHLSSNSLYNEKNPKNRLHFPHGLVIIPLVYPGVAQLVARLLWEIDRVSQTCYNSKCKTRWNTKQIRINLTQF